MIANTVKNGSKRPKQTLISAQVTAEILDGINRWLAVHPELEGNQSIFARIAFKEKLQRDGVHIKGAK